jgi:crotonobetaine/carnitine-CoA ligase
MESRAEAVARGFFAAGVVPGETVGIILPNRIEMLDCFFSLAKLGAIQVPLNVYLKGEFLRHQLLDSSVSTLVVDQAGLETVRPLLGELPSLQRLVVLDESHPKVDEPVVCLRYDDVVKSGVSRPELQSIPSDVVSVLYTSGTTGMPKGCICTHGYYIQTGIGYQKFFEPNSDDILLTVLPLYHMGGQGNALMFTLLSGVSVVFEPEFSASQFINRARDEKATLLFGPGMIATAVLATASSDGDRNHAIRSAALGPLSPPLQLAFEDRFGVAMNSELFGQTECTPVTLNSGSNPRRRDSLGRAAPWIEIRIVDDHDVEVASGVAGELVVRSLIPDGMFSGYWNNPDATVSAQRNLWHHTGDLGRVDGDGYLHFVDRKKDAIRRRGENVSSLELETAIRQIDGVADVAVHGVPSSMTEEEIKVCLVLTDASSITPKILFDRFAVDLPYFAVPRYVEVLPSLPRNSMGRVTKHELRERGLTLDTWDFQEMGLSVDRQDRRASQGAK